MNLKGADETINGRRVTLTVQVDREMAEAFKRVAQRHDRPVAAYLRRLVRQEIEREETAA